MSKKISPNKKTLIMGILNVTPDSFSDGGLYVSVASAVRQAEMLMKEGADIIDIGGESTRPGALPVSAAEEVKRVVPVIKKLKEKFGKDITISIDTNKSEVAEVAIKNGATMVNSLGGFSFDANMAWVVAKYKVSVVIYHIKGEPRTMQSGEIKYKDVVAEINTFFTKQIAIGKAYGVKRSQYILDPGIGFGKSVLHNLTIIKKFKAFTKFKLPLLVGVSRKSHLGKILQAKFNLDDIPAPNARIEAGLAETAVAVLNGASLVRTHDVLATKKFITILDELK